jgi:tetratricopeptide (TPR) repeat protein
MVGYFLFLIGYLYYPKGDFDTSLGYLMKSVKLFENIGFQVGIALNFSIIGEIYLNMGDLNRALEFSNKALSIERISNYCRSLVLSVLGRIYQNTGELEKALMYFKSIKVGEANYASMVKTYGIGEIYRMKGENERAIKYYKQSLLFCENMGSDITMYGPIFFLFLISLDNNSIEHAQNYLKRLENISESFENEIGRQIYSLGQALMLKASSRMHNHVDAERLLKQVIKSDIVIPPFYSISIISLCDLLLEELSMYNNSEVLEDINPLIIILLNKAEEQHSYSWLAEGKLLQAKLELIQMNIEEAKKLLIDAQNTAESHNLSLLSQKISAEHDNLLKQVDEWQYLKNNKAPISDRIELASINGVIGRLQGKSTLDPPDLIDEEPILLLIMDNSGATYFNHPFIANWDHSDLFSSFMSAFNDFSSEIFSNSIDRIKVKENTILIHPVESFLVCYVIEGQSYPALKKLTKFTEMIRENSEIWQALEKSVKTGEVLDLNKPPALKTVIDEIFE